MARGTDVKVLKGVALWAKIVPCECVHEWQDQKYGHGNRVYNPTAKSDASFRTYRCTVCCKLKSLSR